MLFRGIGQEGGPRHARAMASPQTVIQDHCSKLRGGRVGFVVVGAVPFNTAGGAGHSKPLALAAGSRVRSAECGLMVLYWRRQASIRILVFGEAAVGHLDSPLKIISYYE
jgi:hypothetical protein